MDKSRWLSCLPIHVVSATGGSEAIAWLRKQLAVSALVSIWDLPDMKDGEFIQRVKAARLWLPTVVLLDEPYEGREVAARSLGVISVMSTKVEAHVLQRTVAEMLGLNAGTDMIDAPASETTQQDTETNDQWPLPSPVEQSY